MVFFLHFFMWRSVAIVSLTMILCFHNCDSEVVECTDWEYLIVGNTFNVHKPDKTGGSNNITERSATGKVTFHADGKLDLLEGHVAAFDSYDVNINNAYLPLDTLRYELYGDTILLTANDYGLTGCRMLLDEDGLIVGVNLKGDANRANLEGDWRVSVFQRDHDSVIGDGSGNTTELRSTSLSACCEQYNWKQMLANNTWDLFNPNLMQNDLYWPPTGSVTFLDNGKLLLNNGYFAAAGGFLIHPDSSPDNFYKLERSDLDWLTYAVYGDNLFIHSPGRVVDGMRLLFNDIGDQVGIVFGGAYQGISVFSLPVPAISTSRSVVQPCNSTWMQTLVGKEWNLMNPHDSPSSGRVIFHENKRLELLEGSFAAIDVVHPGFATNAHCPMPLEALATLSYQIHGDTVLVTADDYYLLGMRLVVAEQGTYAGISLEGGWKGITYLTNGTNAISLGPMEDTFTSGNGEALHSHCTNLLFWAIVWSLAVVL